MTTIGCIGLGVMGRPMARNLLAAGYDLIAHNRSQGAVDALVAEGAAAADSPGEVASRSDVVFTCLPDTPDLLDVVDRLLAGSPSCRLLIDTSTVAPETARDVAARCGEHSIAAVDAPVSGGEQGAIDGTLSIMAGGKPKAFAAAHPILQSVGSTVAHVGPPGAGQTVKAANQLLVAGTIGLVSEALLLLEGHGIDTDTAFEVLGSGLAGSAVLQRKGPPMATRSFAPGFRMDLQDKDLRIALASARAAGVGTPLTALVEQLVAAALHAGDGGLDHGALVRVIERLSGHDASAPAEAGP